MEVSHATESVIQVPLTNGGFTVVDAADAEMVFSRRWRSSNRKNRGSRSLYACSSRGVLMHRLILSAPRGVQVDHRDRDGLNNRRSNLRLCTQSQNNANQAKTRGTSRFKGVCWDKHSCKWQAAIQINHDRRYIGLFTSQEAAARAYDAAALELFGEFARLNFGAMVAGTDTQWGGAVGSSQGS